MPNPQRSYLKLENITYSIEGESVLEDISFSLFAGEVCCLLGPSGCGKTTLLRLIAGLLSPQKGQIYFNQDNVTRINGSLRLDQHPVMMVFQDLGLFPHMSVAENVAYGLAGTRATRRQKTQEMLSRLDLDDYSKRYPHELSGGQQQRVALARALVLQPKILLLDEPFANLDTALRQPLAEQTLSLLREQHIVTLLVTHDREDALSLGDYVGVMDGGNIIQWGTPQQLLKEPASPRVARFIGHNATLVGHLKDNGEVETILGRQRIEKNLANTTENATVQVLLRCSDARVTTNPDRHPAKVIYRSYEADQLIYALKLANNEHLFALADGSRNLSVGQSTYVELINLHATIYR